MASVLSESLIECSGFDIDDVGRRYLEWYNKDGFDTGPVAGYVFQLVNKGYSYAEAAKLVDDELGGMTAGCNPAHRAAPLAGCLEIADDDLVEVAIAEAALTHHNPIAGDVSVAVVVICRSLISGCSWVESLEKAREGRSEIVQNAIDSRMSGNHKRDGFAPNVLSAAIYYVQKSNSLEEVVERAVRFAGASNYCPILVGCIGRMAYKQ